MGWLLVAFDLPTDTEEARRAASKFRRFLLKDGCVMLQFSFYARPLVSEKRQRTHSKRIMANLPIAGRVRVIFVSQFQWEQSLCFSNYRGISSGLSGPERLPTQLELWQ